jgi:hypothetical protein
LAAAISFCFPLLRVLTNKHGQFHVALDVTRENTKWRLNAPD